jgi:hypothetical protein
MYDEVVQFCDEKHQENKPGKGFSKWEGIYYR